jgi:hypothetical protein
MEHDTLKAEYGDLKTEHGNLKTDFKNQADKLNDLQTR